MEVCKQEVSLHAHNKQGCLINALSVTYCHEGSIGWYAIKEFRRIYGNCIITEKEQQDFIRVEREKANENLKRDKHNRSVSDLYNGESVPEKDCFELLQSV